MTAISTIIAASSSFLYQGYELRMPIGSWTIFSLDLRLHHLTISGSILYGIDVMVAMLLTIPACLSKGKISNVSSRLFVKHLCSIEKYKLLFPTEKF